MLWLILLCIAVALSTALATQATVSLMIPACLFVPFVFFLRRAAPDEDRDFVFRQAIIAFCLRITLTYVVEALGWVEKWDARRYDGTGRIIADWIHGGRYEALMGFIHSTAHPGYYVMIGGIYWLLGPNMLFGQTLSALFSTLTAGPVYLLGREVSPDPRVARYTMRAFVWFPNTIIWGTQLLKDSVILLILVALVLQLVRVLKGDRRLRTMLLLVFCTALLAELRFYLPVVIYSGCAFVCPILMWSGRKNKAQMIVFVTLLVVIFGLGIGLTSNYWMVYLQLHDWRDLGGYRAATGGGGSDFQTQVSLDSPATVVTFLPTGLAYFLAGPFPWQLHKFVQFLTLLDLPIWYPTLLFGFGGLWLLVRRPLGVPLFSVVVGLTLFYSLFLANLGTAYRMRLQITPFMLVAAAFYYVHRHEGAPTPDRV